MAHIIKGTRMIDEDLAHLPASPDEKEGVPQGTGKRIDRHELELRQMLMAAQRMTHAAGMRAHKMQELHENLIQRYFELMMEKRAQPTNNPEKAKANKQEFTDIKEIVLVIGFLTFSVFAGEILFAFLQHFMPLLRN